MRTQRCEGAGVQRMERRGRRKIAEQLVSSGLRRGGCVLVHASLRSMGYVAGGAETVIGALLDALGPGATLLMPALSYEYVDARRPVFDVLRTPSNVGIIAETFRTRHGTIRSVHPTHSVCGVGPMAQQMLSSHRLDTTPCGPRSPYRALRDHDGQVVFLGCGLRPNTSVHGIEELVEPPYLFGPTVTYRVILADGSETALRSRSHGFWGCVQRYDRMGSLLSHDDLKTGKVLDATVHILECRPMWRLGEQALRRDPFFFVDKRG